MKAFMSMIFMITFGFTCANDGQATEQYDGLMPEVVVTAGRHEDGPYVGAVPGVVVTAQRYTDQDEAWSGMMPGITVTATRYEEVGPYVGAVGGVDVIASRHIDEDEAWSGMMPEVVVTAPRYTSTFQYILISESRDHNNQMNKIIVMTNIDKKADVPENFEKIVY